MRKASQTLSSSSSSSSVTLGFHRSLRDAAEPSANSPCSQIETKSSVATLIISEIIGLCSHNLSDLRVMLSPFV
ncbi:hypothetical protein NQZ68_018510 [Dissostichus eleginoides]|nr:hypothetical protein NQZ68_018510 [Dissostichus eleginoides]